MIAGMPSVLWSTAGGRISAEARAKVFVRRNATRIGLGSSHELASGGRSVARGVSLSSTRCRRAMQGRRRFRFPRRSWIVVILHFRFVG